MDKIREHLWVGNMEAVEEENLRENGITAVLNVAYEINDPARDYKEVKQIKVGLGDAFDNSSVMKEIAVNTLKTLLYNGENVLVHCAVGASRSVFVVVKAIAQMEDKANHDVLDEVQKIRPIAMYGPLFADF